MRKPSHERVKCIFALQLHLARILICLVFVLDCGDDGIQIHLRVTVSDSLYLYCSTRKWSGKAAVISKGPKNSYAMELSGLFKFYSFRSLKTLGEKDCSMQVVE